MPKAKLAYAIWTWGLKTKEQTMQGMRDVRAAGYRYFESVCPAVDLFKDDIAGFKAFADEIDCHPVSYYFWHRDDPAQDVETFRKALDFLAANKIRTVSVQAKGKKGGGATPDELAQCVKIIAEMGKLGKPYGITPCLHPHANTVVMFEKEIDFVMNNTNPDEVAFGPDTAHLAVGLCDPVIIFQRYVKRIRFVHLKDVRKNRPMHGDDSKGGFEVFSNFLELGTGDVDLPSCLKILEIAGFDGYLTVELDKAPVGNRESAVNNMKYMQNHGYR